MPYRIPCQVRLVDATTGEVRTVVGETLNISKNGVALQVGAEVPLGTWVETMVLHPHGDPMFLSGKTVHVRRAMTAGYEVGVALEGPRTVS